MCRPAVITTVWNCSAWIPGTSMPSSIVMSISMSVMSLSIRITCWSRGSFGTHLHLER